jgi:hypothetical protein
MGNYGKRLILIELNEINFEVVEKYVAADAGRFPALTKLLNAARIRTTSEENYEQLEPWIQWPSVHTGRTFAEHGIFRLGDVVGTNTPQIFEQLEQAGRKVGVISAMNAENRLSNPAYFVPDPWTQTPSDGSWWSRILTEAISQTVNDNAQARITSKSALQIALALLRFARPNHYGRYLQLVMSSRKKRWLKPLLLDLLLHDVHWSMFNKKRPDFSTLFLNAGAHIQHHYFFNAEPLRSEVSNKNPLWYVKTSDDPVADVLGLYDLIVGEYFSRTDTEIILATGLAQKPYDRLKFYYRLNAHADFLRSLGIEFTGLYPRMTRDFLIEFDTETQASAAQAILADIQVRPDGCALFGEIDNRGKSLFVTLTYPEEITDSTEYVVGNNAQLLKPVISFVAIKNGMHQAQGFAFFTSGIKAHAPKDMAHVSSLGKCILSYFDVYSQVAV